MEPPTDPPSATVPPGPEDDAPQDDAVAAVETRQSRRSTVVDFLTSVADFLTPWT